jgi:uncharacterized membrane protein YkoI
MTYSFFRPGWMVRISSTISVLLFFLPVDASLSQTADEPLVTCLNAAAEIKAPGRPGDFVKVEYLDPSADGVPAYEIELRNASGQEWEFMCDAAIGQIYEIEQEASSINDPRFDPGVGLDAARETVLALYDGEIGEIEYEIESNGQSSYELDVYADGTEWKIEVDAASGDIIEVHVERWEIGIEADERVE